MHEWAPWLLLSSTFVAPILVWISYRAALAGIAALLLAGSASFSFFWMLDIPEENVAEGFGQGLGLMLSAGGTLFGLVLVALSALLKRFARSQIALEKPRADSQLPTN